MKLRTDKHGKPLIVLEAGDVATLEKAAAILARASVHVGGFPTCKLRELADDIRNGVLTGEVPGLALPRKRARKPEPGGVSAPDGPLASVPLEQPDEPPFVVAETCAECHEPLKPSELRMGRTVCYVCRPLVERSA